MESLLAWLLLVGAAYSLGWLVAEALSSRWAPRMLAAALVGLVVADVILSLLPMTVVAWR